MANPVYITSTGTGASRAVNLDYRMSPFNASVAVTYGSTGNDRQLWRPVHIAGPAISDSNRLDLGDYLDR